MNPEDREQLRISLLRFLGGRITRFGTPLSFLVAQARFEGMPRLTDAEVEAELMYLEGRGLVDVPLKAVSPEMRNWRITSLGRDFMAERAIG